MLWSFLCITDILLVFQSDGSKPELIEFSNITFSTSQITGDSSLSTLGCKLSGPHDLFVFNFPNSFNIFSVVNCMTDRLFSGIVYFISGILCKGSIVKALEKYSEKTLAFS